jgi:SAM-dependent methyltransferase
MEQHPFPTGGTMIDWLKLWRELVERRAWRFQGEEPAARHDHWQARAHEFDSHVKRKWSKPDSSRAFIVSMIDAQPGATVLDIGAGTGKWAILLAPHAQRITAVEPSPSMLERLRANLAAEKIANVDIVPEAWPLASIAAHDFTLCSHAMYGAADFESFIQGIQATTRRTCFLLMRAPVMDDVMAEASMKIWGHAYDSANFQVGLNALWQMGIFPNVQMEDSGLREPWVNASIAEAFSDMKRRLGLSEVSAHDDFLIGLLRRRLTLVDGNYVWPRGARTAMLYWQPAARQSSE